MSDQSLPRHFTMARDEFHGCVRRAAPVLKDPGDRNAVLYFAVKAPKVAVGAWGLQDCRCPASAVGIDRFQPDAQDFAGLFDQFMCDKLDIDCEDAQATGIVVEVSPLAA